MNSPRQLANYLKEYFLTKFGNNTLQGSLFADTTGYDIGSASIPFDNLYVSIANISPTSPTPPFVLNDNAQYQEVIGLRAAQVGAGVAGLGLVWTSGSLSVGVANTGAPGLSIENNAIRLSSSYDVGTVPSSQVLASTSVGGLTLATLTTTGIILGGANTDTLHQLGNLKIGKVGATGSAGIAHTSFSASTDIMLQQQSTGDVFLNAPTGKYIYHRINQNTVMQMDASRLNPGGSIAKDLGDYNRKWRTLFAAELYVETLVAQEVMATIGGRVMVTPTTSLVADCGSGASTIDVKHNNLSNGMFIYMSSAPGGVAQIEAFKVTSSATVIPGGYFRYSVTRGEGVTSPRDWVSGDAVVSLGANVGQGYIELTSTYTIHNHLGPNITIYSRTGTTNWDDVKPVVSVGNLRSFAGYSTDTMGFAHGNDLTLTPTTGFKGVTSDNTNGLRLFSVDFTTYNGSTKVVEITSAGNIKAGTNTTLSTGTTLDFTASTGAIRIGPSTGAPSLYWNGTTLSLKNSAGDSVIYFDPSGGSYFAGVMKIDIGGEIRQGAGTLGTDFTGLRIWRESGVGRIGGYNTDVLQWYADTDGMLKAGAGTTVISKWGLDIAAYTGSNPNPEENIRSIGFWGDLADIGSTTVRPAGRIWGGSNISGEYVIQFEVFHPTETATPPKMYISWNGASLYRALVIDDFDNVIMTSNSFSSEGEWLHLGEYIVNGPLTVTGAGGGLLINDQTASGASMQISSPVASSLSIYDYPNSREVMTMDGSGNIIFPYSGTQMLIGAAAGSGARLEVYQPGSSSAIPTLSLTQADLSEEFINFRGTVAAGNPIDTAAIGTYYGKIRCSVNGTFKYIALYNT